MAEYLIEAQKILGSTPRGGTKFNNTGLWRSWCARWFEEPEDQVRFLEDPPNSKVEDTPNPVVA